MAEIAVVIPCHNVADFLEECVQSVMQQGFGDIEIVLVNNNSTDHTWEVMTKIASENSRVVVLDETKKGASAARNTGWKSSKAPFIQFLDADDLLLPSKLTDQLEQIRSEQTAFVVSPFIRRDVKGAEKTIEVEPNIWRALFITRLGITSSALFRRSALENVNGWNEQLRSSQEYDLMFRMLKNGAQLSVATKAQTVIRERDSGQISTSDPAPRWTQYILLRQGIIDFLQKEKKDVWAENTRFFLQSFFDQLNTIAPYVPALAVQLHDEYIKGKFKPMASLATSSKFLVLYRLFGFSIAHRIKQRLSL